MEKWLKETVPGIILLGAIGSIFAVTILKLVAFLFRRYFLRFVNYYALYEIKSMARENWILGYLAGRNDISRIAIYILRQVYLFIIFFFVGIIALLVLLFNINQAGVVNLSATNLIAVTVLIICTYRTAKTLWILLMSYSVHVYPGYEPKKTEDEERKNEGEETKEEPTTTET